MSSKNPVSTTNFEKEIQRTRAALGQKFQPIAKNLSRLLAQNAQRFPDKTLLSYYDDDRGTERHLNWHDAAERVAQTAGFLKDAGVGYGDRVAFLIGNLDHTLILYLATWALGASVAPINAGEDFERKAFIAKSSGARLLFARSDYLDDAKRLAKLHGLRVIVVSNKDDEPVEDPSLYYYPALLDESLHIDLNAVDFEGDGTEALLIYTSGTTGAPKGVRVDQRNIMANAAGMAQWHGWDDGLRMMCVLPVHHVNGIIVTLATPLYLGGTMVLNQRFNSATFWERIQDEEVQVVSVVPTLLEFLASTESRALEGARFADWDTSSLETILCGAGPLLVDTVLQFEERFGVRITHGYGLSETTCYNCHMPPDLDREARHHWYTTHGFPSIGAPLPYQDMAILGEDGDALSPGERGEIAIRGECISLGYDRRPDANAESFRDGWFRSGDEGFFLLDDDGRRFFFITGRLKELIIRGGVNYSPLEIDEVLKRHPAVEAALCLPFANRFYGEEVAAYVVLKDGATLEADELIEHCCAHLEFSKTPKVIIFGSDIPYTTTGKPQRLELARQLAGELEKHRDTQFRR